jgi:hypothetical protein
MSWTIKAADELEMGVKVEMEHADTIKWLIEKVSSADHQKGAPVSEDLVKEVATKIAQDHLKEMKDYYTKLKAMEGQKGAKAEKPQPPKDLKDEPEKV